MQERDDTISDVNLAGEEGIDDMIKMGNLSEEGILKNLKIRYYKQRIYTNTGTILVSVNPYQELPIYTQEVAREYIGRAAGSIRPPPHIFATAEACYHDMREDARNQSVIISGESGAGKTEATKLILQYLAARTNRHSEVEQMILESSPVLEAFGNAKTVRNDNSSRFGKFIEIHFGGMGQICGARIINYLLERSRLVFQAEGERNYHVFYQMLAGSSPSEKEEWELLPLESYHYLNQSGCTTVPHIHDDQDFDRLRMALSALDVPNSDQEQLFKTLSGILRLGNITFEGSETSKVVNMKELEVVARLLGVQCDALAKALTTRTMAVSGQTITLNLKPDQATDARDALAKSIYCALFDWLVLSINRVIHKPKLTKSFIGVLDIFGFENFKVNSFEQMCINYANEKLQNFFNATIFKLEQEEYQAEGIPVQSVAYNDNQDCIDMIEKIRPPGILALLDEECRFPKATDQSFLAKLNTNHGKHAKFDAPKKSRTSFVIKHYAGEVAYEVTGFLDKNKDTLPEDLLRLLSGSLVDLIRTIFSTAASDMDAPKSSKGKAATVGTIFKNQLNDLMATLGATSPHYVRCIKPNTLKKPDLFDDEMVLAQLRYAGMMETIRIRNLGYPIRFPAKEFLARYRALMPTNTRLATPSDMLIGCAAILTKVGGSQESWQVGKTKVFMKDAQYDYIESAKANALTGRVILIQSWWRMIWVRNYYLDYRAACIKVQAFIRGIIARRIYAEMLAAERERKRRLEEEARRKREAEERARREAAAAAERAAAAGAASGDARPSDSTPIAADSSIGAQHASHVTFPDPVRDSVLYEVNKLPDITLEIASTDADSADSAEPAKLSITSISFADNAALPYESPRVVSLRRRVTEKLMVNKTRTPMQRKEGQEEIPDIVSQSELGRYSFEEYARVHFNMMKRKSTISIRRQRAYSTLQIVSYSKRLDFPLHKTSNVNYHNLALTLFRKITRFVDGEEGYAVIKDLFVAGIAHPSSFRNEIYAQIMKQASFNPSKDGTLRAWELLAACCGVFPPTDYFLPYGNYVGAYLIDASGIPGDLGAYARYAYDKLKLLAFRVKQKENRQYPPSLLEFEANKERRQMKAWFMLPSGSEAAINIDPVSTAADVFTPLTTKAVRLAEPSEFAIFEVYPQSKLERSLAPTDFIADIYSKAEKYGLQVQLVLKKKMWLDPSFTMDDPAENRLEVFQVHQYIVSERMPVGEYAIAPLCAARIMVEGVESELATNPNKILLPLIPPKFLQNKPAGEWAILIQVEIAKIKRLNLEDNDLLKHYLTVAKKLPFYGLSMFHKVALETVDLDLPDECMVGIGLQGLLIFDPASQHKLRQINYWEVKQINFTVNTCTVFFKYEEMEPLKMITLEGVEMASLMEDYMFWLREDSSTARAVVDYLPRDRSLLSFHRGDIITITSRDPSGWWKGKCGGKTGQFPKDNVEVLILRPGNTAEDLNNSSQPSLKQRLMKGTVFKDESMREEHGGVAKPTEMKGVARKNSRAYYLQPTEETGGEDKKRNRATLYQPVTYNKRYPLVEYIPKHFNVDELVKEEKILAKPGLNVNEVLSRFSESPLKIPLHKGIDDISAKLAVDLNVHIMQYMGDYPSKKTPYELMVRVCQTGIEKANLRDEIFCQLLKQINKNPKPASQVKGLELLSICCGLFVPSRALGPYLLDFLHLHTKLSSNDCTDEKIAQDISRLAAAGMGRLDRMRASGVRSYAPSQSEYAQIRLGNPVQVRVWTLDTATKGVLVDMAATVRDAAVQLIKDLRLSTEAVTKRDWRLYAFLGTDEDAKKRFNGAVGTLLQERDNICDIMAKWEMTAKGKEALQFVFQESMSLNPHAEIADPIANHLLCHQAIATVNSGKQPVTEGEAAYLAALQYFLEVSRTVKDPQKAIIPAKGNEFMQALTFLPPFAFQMKPESEWLHAIYNEFDYLDKSLSVQKVEELYLSTVRRWKYYGSTIFFCEGKQYPGTNAIAINRDGLIILRLPQKEPLAVASFKAISNWSATKNDTLGVVAGSLMNPQRLVFTTPQAAQVVQAFEKIVEKLVQEKKREEEKSKPNYMPGATFRSTFLTHKKPF